MPSEVGEQTKPAIALGLLDRAREWGVPIQAVMVDAGYEDNPNFLTGLDDRQVPYVCAVQSTYGVRLPEGVQAAKEQTPTYGGRGQPRKPRPAPLYSVKELIRKRPGRKKRRRRAYWYSTLSPETELAQLVMLAHARWVIEQFYEDVRAANVAWMISRDGAGMACIGTWRWSCSLTVSWRCNVLPFLCLLVRTFPPSVTRSSLPHVHRQVLVWLFQDLVLWLIQTDQIKSFRPRRN
jgi:hypothetical protein